MNGLIGGNTTAKIQTRTITADAYGEHIETWVDAASLTGWLDLSNGDSRRTNYAKMEESTHVFVSDYIPLTGIVPENSRMVINGNHYDILLIDNPMEMGSGSQLEIYLKFLGG